MNVPGHPRHILDAHAPGHHRAGDFPAIEGAGPEQNSAVFNAGLSGCFLLETVESCRTPDGAFWLDLAFSDPQVSALMTEVSQGVEDADFVVTNGTVTNVEPWNGVVYRVVLVPTDRGQPVTIQLPANSVLDIGEGLTADGVNTYTRNNTASNVLTLPTAGP